MFPPMTPTTERIRIQNETELNRQAARYTQPLKLGRFFSLLRFSRPKAQRSPSVQPRTRHAHVGKGA